MTARASACLNGDYRLRNGEGSFRVHETSWQEAFRQLLLKDFRQRQERNPRFSMRQYGRRLGLSPGATSDLLHGKRNLARPRAANILAELDVSEREKHRLQALMGAPVTITWRAIRPEDFDLFTDWRNWSLLALFENGFSDPQRIATRWGLDATFVRERVQSFLQRGYLVQTPEGIEAAPGQWDLRTLPPEQLGRFLEERTKALLETLPRTAPEMQGLWQLNFAVSEEQLRQLLTQIHQFVERLIATKKTDAEQDLFQIFLHALPLRVERPPKPA